MKPVHVQFHIEVWEEDDWIEDSVTSVPHLTLLITQGKRDLMFSRSAESLPYARLEWDHQLEDEWTTGPMDLDFWAARGDQAGLGPLQALLWAEEVSEKAKRAVYRLNLMAPSLKRPKYHEESLRKLCAAAKMFSFTVEVNA